MARIRSVHPGLFTDEAFVTISDAARVTFIGIWTECDDHGIFEWKPVRLKIRLRPCNGEAMDALLAELVEEKMILKFEEGGKVYGAVRQFCLWQRPKAPQYIYPCPDEILSFVSAQQDTERRESRGSALGKMLADAQGHKCFYCSEPISFYRKKADSLEVDHKTPISRGGADCVENLVAACKPCNAMKRTMTAEEFFAKFSREEMVANCRHRRRESCDTQHSHNATEESRGAKNLSGEIPPQMEDGGGRRRGREEEEKKASESVAKATRLADSEIKFQVFKAKYPSRGNAPNPWQPARKRWDAAVARGVSPDQILAALAAGTGFDPAKIGTEFIPRASTWLSEQRWSDAPAPPAEAETVTDVWLSEDSAEFEAWEAYCLQTKGKRPPRDRAGGWRFPQRVPPSHNHVLEAAE
jgi:5-methylcytosine-specific restriction endonuclease McrA